MRLSLAENVKRLRKERALTQEQLSEVLGVSVGAVHKWEAGTSLPELGTIVEMADFFDTSVDALLGYRMRDNRQNAALERIDAYCKSKDPEALAEAEKALKKYPHSFEVVHGCAAAYLALSAGSGEREKPRRALELLAQARLLLPQNTDPEIGELSLCREMAGAYVLLGEPEKAIELLKAHNTERIFSHSIGTGLAVYLKRPAEAEPFLANAMLQSIPTLSMTLVGYVFVYCARREYAAAQEALAWGMPFLRGLKNKDEPCFLDKNYVILLVLLSHVQLQQGRADEARATLEQAAALARRFDAAPNYGASALRFTGVPEDVSIHDTLGTTVQESIENMLHLTENKKLIKIWKEIKENA